MYSDRVETESRISIKDRLDGNIKDDSFHRRQVTGKRQRQDDKWEHDLFENDLPQVSNRRFDAQDLRLKLQRKNLQQASVSGRSSNSGVKDLREKLSGIMHPQPLNADPPKPKVESAELARKSVVRAPAAETKRAAHPANKKSTHKAGTSVYEFLHSLGLEKHFITFQAEEIDMTALLHMTDDDLKAIGIPMGPRKKILLALESRS